MFVEWNIPTWTDDKTAANKLTIVGPGFTPPVQLSLGTHQMKYVAHDHEGAKAECVFPVIITSKYHGVGSGSYLKLRALQVFKEEQ